MASSVVFVFLTCVFTTNAILDKIQWQPVFRVRSGSGQNVFKLWTGDTTLDEEWGFKSDLVNSWKGINKVKLTMSSDGVEQMSLVFDGRNSDRLSWFSAHRLLASSPYTDLAKQHHEFFSLLGMHQRGQYSRRFYISHNSGSCTSGKGWLMVVDTDSVSDCEVENYPRPVFLYSQWKGYANTMYFSTADALTISVEADDPSQWDMVFRATPGVDANIYNLWVSNLSANIANEEMHTTLGYVAGVYKSDRVNAWSQVQKVKMAVYQNGEEKAYFIFDAHDSDRMSWFTRENLISTNYVDINDYDMNFFSITGHAFSGGIQRRFYIMRNYGSFCVDFGWFIVVDQNSRRGCYWDTQGPNPAFLYSKERTLSRGEKMERAEVFAIFFNKEREVLRDLTPVPAYHELESHWTRTRTGCQCYFDNTRTDCACCIEGGCQCTFEHPKQCVQCGYNERCGLPELAPGAWTGNTTCACRNDTSKLTCACCNNNGCQCVQDSLRCTQCGREDQC